MSEKTKENFWRILARLEFLGYEPNERKLWQAVEKGAN